MKKKHPHIWILANMEKEVQSFKKTVDYDYATKLSLAYTQQGKTVEDFAKDYERLNPLYNTPEIIREIKKDLEKLT